MHETTRFTLNGKTIEYSGDGDRRLLRHLRDHQKITSVKDGCSGQAFCGACLVEIDGKPTLSCVTRMDTLEGKSVRTLEGFPEDVKASVATIFVKHAAVQCGFCTPGILIRMLTLLRDKQELSREEIVSALDKHLCRCTGYVKIIDAMEDAAELLSSKRHSSERKQTDKETLKMTGIGVAHPKYDAFQKALGKSPFVDDISIDNMLHGVLLFSEHPRAKIEKLDTTKAASLDGVAGIFTASDIPGKRITGLIAKDWPMMITEGETTKYIGDVLAVIVAETREQAEHARDMIETEYLPLPPVTDPEEALKDDIKVHQQGNLLDQTIIDRRTTSGGLANLSAKDVLEKSAYVSCGTYTTQRIEHAFLEPEAAVARFDEQDKLEIFTQTQGVYEDRHQIATILDIPQDRVVVTLYPTGGGFGGKEDMSVQHHAALACWLLKRPVKIRLTRQESLRMHPKRHPMKMEYALGCDAAGKITALKARIIGDTGAYASVGMKVLERAAGHATGAYYVPTADIVAKAVYTNNVPCGAMRGFGVNQTNFAMEQCIEDLCNQGGFDSWQFRYDNALVEGTATATGQILEHAVGVRSCLEALKTHYDENPGAGLACGIKNCGIGNGMVDESDAVIEIHQDGRVTLHHGWTEMGQGVDTVAIQVFCQETGVDPAVVDVKVSTRFEAKAGMTTASRATVLLGNAMKNAASKMVVALKEASIPMDRILSADILKKMAGRKFHGNWCCDWTTKPGSEKEITHFGYGYAAQLAVLDENSNIKSIYAAHDAGKVINPKLFEGQIEGAVVMGTGYALTEDLPMKDGKFVSEKMRDLGLLRAGDIPEIVVIPVEVNDPVGPYGAKGIGEIGLVPTAPAIANARFHKNGVRTFALPLNKSNDTKNRGPSV